MKRSESAFSRKYLVPLLIFLVGVMWGSDESGAVAVWAIYGALLVLLVIGALHIRAYRQDWRTIGQRRIENLAALHKSAPKPKK